MKIKYPIRNRDLRHQPRQTASKRIQLFQKCGTDPDNARFLLKLFKRREIVKISDGKKLKEGKKSILFFDSYLNNKCMNKLSVF